MQDNISGQPAPTATNTNVPTNTDQDSIDNLSDDEVIDYFVRGIMQEKGIDAPTPEIKQDVFENLKADLLEQIDRSLIAELPDNKLDELNNMATQDGKIDPAIVAKMIEEANLNVSEITGATMARFRDIYLGQTTSSEAEK